MTLPAPSIASTEIRLSPAELLRAADEAACDLFDGRYADRLPRVWPGDRRLHIPLSVDHRRRIWLVGWSRADGAAGLRDTAGTTGAVTVLTGSLLEYRWIDDGLRRRRLADGDQSAYPAGRVYELIADPAAAGRHPSPLPGGGEVPTLSVHAYTGVITEPMRAA